MLTEKKKNTLKNSINITSCVGKKGKQENIVASGEKNERKGKLEANETDYLQWMGKQ